MNLTYQAGITMEQEASWVGLGWNLSPGTVNRNLRGLPDDFMGDQVEETVNMKDHETHSTTAKIGIELIGLGGDGKDKRTLNPSIPFTVTNDNYTGYGFQTGLSYGLDNILQKSRPIREFMGFDEDGNDIYYRAKDGSGQVQGTLGFSSNGPAQVSGSVSLPFAHSTNKKSAFDGGLSLSATRSQRGVYEYNVQAFAQKEINGKATRSSGMNLFTTMPVPIPSVSRKTTTYGAEGRVDVGFELKWTNVEGGLSGSHTITKYVDKKVSRPAYGYFYTDQGYRFENEEKFRGHDWLMDFGRENDVPIEPTAQNLPMPYLANDVFTINGQGIGGQFRGRRNDIGFVHDPKVDAAGYNGDGSYELGFGDLGKIGGSIGGAYTDSDRGKWMPVGRLVDLSDDEYSDDDPTKGVNVINNVRFRDYSSEQQNDNPAYEGFYLASNGEVSGTDAAIRGKWSGTDAVRFSLEGIINEPKFSATHSNKIETALNKGIGTTAGTVDNTFLSSSNRQPRSQHIKYLTAEEADEFLLHPDIKNYDPDKLPWEGPNVAYSTSDRVNTYRQKHHLSQIEAVNAGGAKYVYGIPVYNTEYEEAMFNVSDEDGLVDQDCVNGTVKYEADVDNSVDNTNGVDWFASIKKMDPYPTSFLLTEMQSPDYVDVTGNGVSDDDIGTAVKFNYTQHSGDFKWRFPYSTDAANPEASYMPAQYSNPHDDRGSYTYGSKEIWYPHSIESRQEIAIFHLDETARKDGLGVNGHNGGTNANATLKRLKKIEIYTKEELRRNGTNAVPHKTVHFKYDYLLCKGVPNHADYDNAQDYSLQNAPNHGKLTLTEVYFTYGRSSRGKSNPYKFHYADPDHNGSDPNQIEDYLSNPPYLPNAHDRWGSYQNLNDCANDPYAHENYYTIQDKVEADKNAAMWNLHTIDLPSGGRLEIDYEADDYAFVQNKRAMQMLKIKSTWTEDGNGLKDEEASTAGMLYDDDKLYNVMAVELPVEIDGSLNETDALARAMYMYLKDQEGNRLSHIRYRVLTELHTGKKEFVDGYVGIEQARLSVYKESSSDYNRLAVWIDYPKTIDDDGVFKSYQAKKDDSRDYHPIAWAAWDYMSANTPRLVTNTMNDGEEITYDQTVKPKEAWQQLGASIGSAWDFARSYQKTMKRKKLANKIDLNYAWMRFYSPQGAKIGGGHRVKTVRMKSNWYAMSSSTVVANTETMGQEYDYSKPETTDSYIGGRSGNEQISSGVATYEPIIGGEENPWRELKPISMKKRQMPGLSSFYDYPQGESFFAGASITYSRVKVRNIVEDQNAPNNGTTIHQFYTSRDFPVKVKSTSVEKNRFTPSFSIPFFFSASLKALTMTQGYSIELNNMNGRHRATWYLGEEESEEPGDDNTYLHGQVTKYFTDQSGGVQSIVPIMDRTGNEYDTQELGVTQDVYCETRSTRSFVAGLRGNMNMDVSTAPPVPVFGIPTMWANGTMKEENFRSSVVTKLTSRMGFVREAITYADGTMTKVINKAFDPLTGAVLKSESQNEFKDPIYNQSYLARWLHKDMEASYQNYRTLLTEVQYGVSIDGYKILQADNVTGSATIGDYLMHGDEVVITRTQESNGRYVTDLVRTWFRLFVFEDDAGDFHLITEDGTPYTPGEGLNILVINPARKNLLGAGLGQVTTHGEPFLNAGGEVNINADVIGGSAVEYKDDWNLYCCGIPDPDHPGIATTPTYDDPMDATRQLLLNEHIKNAQVNPFLANMSGFQRPYKTLVYQGERTESYYASSTNPKDLKMDESGFINNFNPYYEFNNSKLRINPNASTSAVNEWEEAAEITIIDPRGFELESKNALDIYSATTMGYNQFLPTATAQNSKLRNFGFDGFEDYSFKRGGPFKMVYPEHFGFNHGLGGIDVGLDETVSHTGTYSLLLSSIGTGGLGVEHYTQFNTAAFVESAPLMSYVLDNTIESDKCIPQFSPEAGDYFISAWVKEEDLPASYSYSRAYVKVEALDCDENVCPFQDDNDNNINMVFRPEGPVIDGWQRVQGKFTLTTHCSDCYGATKDACCTPLPGTCFTKAAHLRVYLGFDDDVSVGGPDYKVWFDDVRVFPADAAMTSYVYNPYNLKLEAVLDQNNYASIYEYALDGALERTKKETERGVMTISENRQHIKE